MTYFKDLSNYGHRTGIFYKSAIKNIGWLEAGHRFETQVPTEEILDFLWCHCQISVAQTRGIHQCDLCSTPQIVLASRGGPRLLLGTSEIRVFSGSDVVYAAPTLIYHYVRTHHYKPPDVFLNALSGGPRPPDEEYFERLRQLTLKWNKTASEAEVLGNSQHTGFRKPVFLDEG
jgi:hypothetical protein